MKTFTIVVLVLLAVSLSTGQTTDARSWNKSITAAWDSSYTYVSSGPALWDISNESTTDTLIYFFGRTKADSSTSAMFRLYPGWSKQIRIPQAGDRWRACFRKSSSAAIISNLEQLPVK
jgi:hypothetical protein